jgi:hypothetical protein
VCLPCENSLNAYSFLYVCSISIETLKRKIWTGSMTGVWLEVLGPHLRTEPSSSPNSFYSPWLLFPG